ncbi:MAG: hypothetical protein RIR86_35 [Acidobacteriota bacterium]|jgi:tetratricopeptide (TPR) repeat protein
MIYCQRCKKPNPNEADHCESCGTYLLVITRTPDALPGETIDNSLEEHLLERISTLESALARSNERFEELLEIAQQQATSAFFDHMMIISLSDLLTESGLVDAEDLEQRWAIGMARHHQETAERELLDERRDRVVSAYRGRAREEFSHEISEGIRHLREGNGRRGLKILDDARRLDPRNVELWLMLGECYFLQGRLTEARPLLDQVIEEHPGEFRACLLLALIAGDNGEIELARTHLQRALAIDDHSFVAHFVLGQLLAREQRMEEALPHLKRALTLNPVPEMHYILGRVYLETGQREQALRQFQKAVRLDPGFDLAQYCLGFLYWQAERIAEARKHLRAAYDFNPHETLYRRAIKVDAGHPLPAPPPVGWVSLVPRRRPRVDQSRFDNLLWREFNINPILTRRKRRETN